MCYPTDNPTRPTWRAVAVWLLLVAAVAVAVCSLLAGCGPTPTPSAALVASPWKRPAPGHLAAPVSVGMFPVTLIGPRHGITAWHVNRRGSVRFPDGQTATIASQTRIGTTDICVVTLDRAVATVPAVICQRKAGYFRNQFGRLLPASAPTSDGRLVYWSYGVGLINNDSGSPLLVDLGNGRVGVCATAYSYTYGPNLWAYRTKIAEAMK